MAPHDSQQVLHTANQHLHALGGALNALLKTVKIPAHMLHLRGNQFHTLR